MDATLTRTPALDENGLLGRLGGELELAIRGGPGPDRLRISAAKTTVGGDLNCGLHLADAGLEPVHCLILRGERATVLRSWAGELRVNDRAVRDAELAPGDVIACGDVELEVVETSAPPAGLEADNDDGEAEVREAAAALADRRAEFQQDVDEFERQRLAWEEERNRQSAEFHDREREIEESAARQAEQNRTDAENARGEWERQKKEAERDFAEGRRRAEEEFQRQSEAERAEFATQRSQWQAECSRQEVEAARQATQIEADRQQKSEAAGRESEETRQRLEAQRQSWERQCEEWDQKRELAEQKLVARSEQIDRRLAEAEEAGEMQREALQRRVAQLERDRDDWLAERQAMEERLAQREAEPLSAPEVQPAEAPSPSSTMVIDPSAPVDWDAFHTEEPADPLAPEQRDEPAALEPSFSSALSDAPVSASTVLERYEQQSETPLGELEEPAPVEPSALESSAAPQVSTDSGPPLGGSGEESIEDYMARLLKRVRGESDDSAESAAYPSPPEMDAVAGLTALREAAEAERIDNVAADKPLEASEFVPRSQPPEKSASMEQMRELANESARTAIHASRRQRGGAKAIGRILVSLVAAGLGVGMILFSGSLLSLLALGGLACFVAAAVFGYQGFTIARDLIIAARLDPPQD